MTACRKYNIDNVMQKFLNLGCGRVILPAEKPAHHWGVPDSVYGDTIAWTNIDVESGVGADKVFDLWKGPWPLLSDHYDGALLTHIVEHIPHDVRVSPTATQYQYDKLTALPDGFFAFFAELWRVCKHDARIHIICPMAGSEPSFIDPTHTRYLIPGSFSYITPEMGQEGAPHEYSTGCLYEYVAVKYKTGQREFNIPTTVTTTYEFYLEMKVIKDKTNAE